MMNMDDTDVRAGRVVARIPADTFAHRLMLSRSHAGHLDGGRPYTIDQAAGKTGQSPQSWSNWERGRIPRDILDVADAIAEGLGVDRDWLLHGGQLSPAIRVKRIRCAYPSETLTIRRHRVSTPEPVNRVRRPRRLDRRVTT